MEHLKLKEEIENLGYNEYIKNVFNASYFEDIYVKSLLDVINNGVESGDRTGTGTIRLETGYRFVFHSEFIPILRGKLINPHNALTEVIWILTGRNDLKFLKDNGVNYWDSWVKEDETFGPIYGTQMRNQNGFDQLLYVIKKLQQSPESRQTLISLWHGSDLDKQALPPCHYSYHPLIVNNKLHLHCDQRSSDAFLGVPYDYMLFYFIQKILCFFTDTNPGNIIHNNHDYHIYKNQFDSVLKYFDNYFDNPDGKFIFPNIVEIYFKLQYPEKPADLTSETLTEWLYKFYELNKNFETNYSDKSNRYGLIKTDVAV